MILYHLKIWFLQTEVSFLYDLSPVSQMHVVLFMGYLMMKRLRSPFQYVSGFPRAQHNSEKQIQKLSDAQSVQRSGLFSVLIEHFSHYTLCENHNYLVRGWLLCLVHLYCQMQSSPSCCEGWLLIAHHCPFFFWKITLLLNTSCLTQKVASCPHSQSR